MSPSLYDLLDVDPAASSDEIREAWKRAIADLDPTDRRFRAYSDAAGVLLDPDRRAEYDAGMVAEAVEDEERAADEPESHEPDDGEPDAEEIEVAHAEASTGGPATLDTAEPHQWPVAGAVPARSVFRARPQQWLIAAVAALALLVVAATAWVATWPGTFGTSPEERERTQGFAAESLEAAERIAPDVLSYDHRSMGDERLAELQELMTPSYAEEFGGVQKDLREEAQRQEAVVTAAVRASALADLGADGRQAEVMIIVDQLVQKAGATEDVLTMWATLRLIREDGTWLLEKICITEPDCT